MNWGGIIWKEIIVAVLKGALASGITFLGTYLLLKYNYKKLFAETISKSRNEWINQFRNEIITFLSLNDMFRTKGKIIDDEKEKGVADSYERKSNDVKFGDKSKVISLDGKTELFSTNDKYSDGQRLLPRHDTDGVRGKTEHSRINSNNAGEGRLIKKDPSNRYSLKRGENLRRLIYTLEIKVS